MKYKSVYSLVSLQLYCPSLDWKLELMGFPCPSRRWKFLCPDVYLLHHISYSSLWRVEERPVLTYDITQYFVMLKKKVRHKTLSTKTDHGFREGWSQLFHTSLSNSLNNITVSGKTFSLKSTFRLFIISVFILLRHRYPYGHTTPLLLFLFCSVLNFITLSWPGTFHELFINNFLIYWTVKSFRVWPNETSGDHTNGGYVRRTGKETTGQYRKSRKGSEPFIRDHWSLTDAISGILLSQRNSEDPEPVKYIRIEDLWRVYVKVSTDRVTGSRRRGQVEEFGTWITRKSLLGTSYRVVRWGLFDEEKFRI